MQKAHYCSLEKLNYLLELEMDSCKGSMALCMVGFFCWFVLCCAVLPVIMLCFSCLTSCKQQPWGSRGGEGLMLPMEHADGKWRGEEQNEPLWGEEQRLQAGRCPAGSWGNLKVENSNKGQKNTAFLLPESTTPGGTESAVEWKMKSISIPVLLPGFM